MDDPVEARALIAEIRHAYEVDRPGASSEISKNLERSLQTLSEELYSTSTHFILEMIQNADDARYGSGIDPKLKMLYRQDGFLWVGCNEIGFTAQNVWAICRVRDSTKKCEGSQKGYIGEKGIGFKSVFTVADKVWIKSGVLSFAFDTHSRLGMIAPEWEEMPLPNKQYVPERTVFCLRIPSDDGPVHTLDDEHEDARTTVEEGLRALKPELLVFLRNLRNISIDVWTSYNIPEYGFKIHREDTLEKGIRVTTLSHITKGVGSAVKQKTLLVFENSIAGMPNEEKRPGVTETSVVLAFPVTDNDEPLIKSQDTFAFLPIRSYGLTFLLQADFILTTAREDIRIKRAWNTRLVKAAAECFVSSVREFNATGTLKYSWPQFVKSLDTASNTVFKGFFNKTLLPLLKRSKVLESRQLTFEAPMTQHGRAMQVIPPVFTEAGGKALFMGLAGPKSYVSPLYNRDDLAALGVQEMTATDFRDALHGYVTADAKTFQTRRDEWHSKLATAICHADPSGNAFRAIGLVPLRGGKWVNKNSAATKPFFFSDLEGSTVVPSGIEVAMIDTKAASSRPRRDLYVALDAQSLNVSRVYEMIVMQHNTAGKESAKWKPSDVISHARFLFNATSKPTGINISGMLVAPEGAALVRPGNQLYMDDPQRVGVRVSDILRGYEHAKFIDQRYFELSATQQAGPWFTFLQNELGVNTLPRLADDQGTSISHEFTWIVAHKSSLLWLKLLKDNWAFYSSVVDGNSAIKSFFSAALVSCKDGQLRPLKDVYTPLAIKDEPLAAGVAPVLATSDPNDSTWTKMSSLGLNIIANAQLYLTLLKRLPRMAPMFFTVDDIKRLYTALHRRTYISSEADAIKAAFKSASLVYIRLADGFAWVPLSAVSWTAPDCLIHVTPLQKLYPDLRSFFMTTLGLREGTTKDVVDRLVACSRRTERVDEIKNLLTYLSLKLNYAKKATEQDVIKPLLDAAIKILPVRLTNAAEPVELRSVSDRSWFYSDTTKLKRAFDGRVALLDFDLIASRSMRPFLKTMGLEGRNLSAQVIDETVATGEQELRPELTERIKSKAKYIKLLGTSQSRDSTLVRLALLEVYSAEGLTVRRHVQWPGGIVYGEEGFGSILRTEKEGKLIVFVSKAIVEQGTVPANMLCDWLAETFSIPPENQKYLKDILELEDEAEIVDKLETGGLMAEVLPDLIEDAEDSDSAEDIFVEEELNVTTDQYPSRGRQAPMPPPLPPQKTTKADRPPVALPRSRYAPQQEPELRAYNTISSPAVNGHIPKASGSLHNKQPTKTNGVRNRGSDEHLT
ncbi:hypothetical protein LTR22_025653 [Elasticomyces elasticus]|nr:hypothetical protein LTR22_025653 [Elasticomyces elasticus]